MPYTRVQLRRGTLAEWTSNNPILAEGEIGLDTDSGSFKFGDGVSNWSALDYFQTTTNVVASLSSGAPVALDTFAELAQAIDNNPDILSVLTPIDSPSFTGTVDFSNATVSGIMLPINWMGEFADADAITYLENDMVTWQGSVYYATGPNLNNIDGYYPTAPGADWQLFASKGDQGEQGPQGDFSLTQEIVELTSSATLSSADVGKLFVNSNASSEITITIDGLQPGQQIDFIQTSSYKISFSSQASTVSGKNGYIKTAAKYSPASIKCITTSKYALVGDIGA